MLRWLDRFMLTGEGSGSLLILLIVQAALGFAGIAHWLGFGWAVGAALLALVFRFTLPLIIGVYFGVTGVLGWHPLVAVLILLPGLLFVIPAVVGAVFSGLHKV